MALKNIILPITQHGSGNTGTTNMDSALGEWFSTNMKSNVDEYDNLPIATPLYTTTHVLPEPPNLCEIQSRRYVNMHIFDLVS